MVFITKVSYLGYSRGTEGPFQPNLGVKLSISSQNMKKEENHISRSGKNSLLNYSYIFPEVFHAKCSNS